MTAIVVALALTLFVFVAGAGCSATTGTAPRSRCNPVMEQCNPADHPPLTKLLPPWPFPSLMRPLPDEAPGAPALDWNVTATLPYRLSTEGICPTCMPDTVVMACIDNGYRITHCEPLTNGGSK